jgi:hypothetical protein
MYESAVRKFKLWEFTDEQIQQIIERGEVQTKYGDPFTRQRVCDGTQCG